MPVYIYKAKNKEKSCNFCRDNFEVIQKMSDSPLHNCPECGSEVGKVFSGFSLGESKTGFDRKAKDQGFHKLKKVDKGKYEKLY
ncbi:MAG: zinc ribbon domain-containing protein [Candidatus Omnitrophota bacterium]